VAVGVGGSGEGVGEPGVTDGMTVAVGGTGVSVGATITVVAGSGVGSPAPQPTTKTTSMVRITTLAHRAFIIAFLCPRAM
jgi:F0F1-type ATP synthase membrane subunit c/vacuolar-type H+-ATPase subunit K